MSASPWINRLLIWGGRFLGRRGHGAVAALLLRSGGDKDSYEAARAHWQAGQYEAARSQIAAYLVHHPKHAEGNNLAGILALQAGDEAAAADHFRRALSVRPAYPAAHNNLGNVLRSQGNFDEAILCYRTALDYDPNYVEALTNLSAVLDALGNCDEAERASRQAIALAPEFAGAHCNLGNALLSQGRAGEAVAAYREALRLQSDLPEALINLYLVLEQPGYLAGVVDYYEEQLRRNPENYQCHLRIAQALQALDDWDGGRERILKALEIRPDAPDALLLLGHNKAHAGDAAGSVAIYRQLISGKRNSAAHSGLVFNLLYARGVSGEVLCDEYRAWAALHAPPMGSGSHLRRRDDTPERKLRIGYVSRDFAVHSVAYFLEPILAHHDRTAVFVACYSTLLQPDAVTERFVNLADAWRDVSLMSLDELERTVLDDAIDILVDLSGHTAGNRLPLFARKPAPIQVTYLGHPATTGLATIDYRIGDDTTDPPGLTETHYSEALVRLPGCFLTYLPSPHAPDVAVPPRCIETGRVTFGSFNNAMKTTDEVIDVWARILLAVPGSTLLLKSHAFGTEPGRERVVDRFAHNGIPEERLRLMAWLPAGTDHLSLYDEVDIALDPFPYNGTTTTCEALWMGVPVITLMGDRHSGRVGASLLSCVGLPDLICDSLESYVSRAVALANDHAWLAEIRAGLRDRLRASPLLDHEGFTRKLESAYRTMWRDWLATAEPAPEEGTGPGGELRLHIGGQQRKPGWTILNINAGPEVDRVGDVRDLSAFRTGSVAEIYASHVLEHVDQQSIHGVLRELRRILRKPGGRLMVSVPDLETLCRLFLRQDLGSQARLHVMRMMYGGQVDSHDYHQIGFYYELLADLLKKAGFQDIRRVDSFGLFDDTSEFAPYGQRISLNVEART